MKSTRSIWSLQSGGRATFMVAFLLGIFRISDANKQCILPMRPWAFQSQAPQAQASKSSEDASDDASGVVWHWEEDSEWTDDSFAISKSEEDTLFKEPKSKRKLVWFGRVEDGSYDPSYRRRRLVVKDPPHKLRMEQWNITFSWRERRRERESLLKFEFHPNGFVRCRHPKKVAKKTATSATPPSVTLKDRLLTLIPLRNKSVSDEEFVLGSWKLAPSGVTWKMNLDESTYHFHADLHLNPFGKYPKMFRGMVIRDRRHGGLLPRRFLRPLVATFWGAGAGKDTADFSYTNRKVGISPQSG